jgi:hypothetical protein
MFVLEGVEGLVRLELVIVGGKLGFDVWGFEEAEFCKGLCWV